MSEELKIIENDDGTFSEYDDTFDITIHCQSEAEQNEVLAKLNADPTDWITEENPEYADAYLVTWRHPLWDRTAYIGLCEWDGERWLVEDMEQSKLYKETLIILAWSDPEPYMGWKETK